ncbi:hypothetical protein EC968_008316 [Mortierella alpina]|nr:hypothetical protein EC968_008316 [Mortierella alpina]
MFMTMLAAWSAVLSRLSGQDDIVIGIPSANRNHPQIEQLIGFFVSTLALRIDLSEDPSVERLLKRVRKVTIAAQAHQDLPFEQVVEIVQPPRRMNQTPVFQVMLAWQNNDINTLQLKNVQTATVDIDHNVLKFDLELELNEQNGEVIGSLKYSTALFDRVTMDRHVGYLEAMLRWMTEDLEQSVTEAQILGSHERELQVETWNRTEQPYPDNICIHHLFERQAMLTSDAIAVLHGDRALTYRELNSRANGLALLLFSSGVRPGDHVAILLERSLELIVAQLAVLKAGAAYVPMDILAPMNRQIYVISDSVATLLITDETAIVPTSVQVPLLRLHPSHWNIEAAQDALDAAFSVSQSSLDTAYVMYTSGSTGQPKGTMVHHRGIARLVINNGFAEICSGDRVAFTTNPAFDPSTYQVWAPLLHGASIVVIDTDTFLDPFYLAEAITRYQVTCMYMTHGVLHQYAFIIGDTLSKLKYLLGGAEQGLIKAYMAVLQHGGPVRMVNRYGPTETTVSATAYTVTRAIEHLERLPIGRPISNTRVYVLDKHLTPVPIGVIGELYIGGAGVANGYLNRPELTAERFLADSFSKVPGMRMYRTGDLVRYLPDGNLVFMGRNDNQVKIRGFRIELEEIEARLADHPQVREAVVLAVGDDSSDKRLVAYIVAAPHDNLVQTLREYLLVSLPEYMVPSAFMRMDAFPLTNNGKIDRRALPQPDESAFVTRDYEEPQGKVEVLLANIWADLLKIDRVGRHDNFFMLGGHSLLAMKMTEPLRQQGYLLSVRALFENPVLHAQAAILRQDQVEPKVPPNLITAGTMALTPDLLPLIDLNQNDIDRIVRQVPGGVTNIQDIYALSPLQDGILFHHMMAKDGDTYLTVICRAFRDKEILDRYLGAFQKVVDRHDGLRTAIMWENLSTPAQVVWRQATLPITEHVLDPANGPIVDQLKQMYGSHKYRIELSTAPLTLFAYAQDVDGRWVAIQLLHHLIGDHSTLEVMQEEIDAILDGRIDSLPPPQPLRNLIAHIQQGTRVEEHEQFFRKMLQDIDSPSLPYGLSDIYSDGSNVADFRCLLPQDLNNKLRGHAKRLGVSLASLCHLAWAKVIAATSGQSQVVFGTVLFGRMQGAGSDRAVGLFINTLPIRVDVEGSSVLDCVRKVQMDLARLLEHEQASLAIAQRCSGVPFGRPLFSSILNYRHNTAPAREIRKRLGIEIITAHRRTNYPFAMSVEDFGSSLGVTAKVAQPYDPSIICGYMQQALHNLVEALEHAPQTHVQTLSIMPAEEWDLIIHSWNENDRPYPDDRCVNKLFEDYAERAPDSVAMMHYEHSMTYRTLNSCASRLAHKLVDLGVQPGDYVVILLKRSFELIISQLAILKVGAAYVPIDIRSPAERQAYIISDSGAKLLITDEWTVVPGAVNAVVLRLCQEDVVDTQEPFGKPLDSPRSSVDTAYVMYTSGSTGQPKGVMVSHRGIARLVINNGFAEICSEDRMAFTTNPAFDPSTYQVWAPLLHGASIVVIDTDTFLDPCHLAEAITRYQVTCMYMSHGVLHQYAFIIGDTLSKLTYLLGGAEQGSIKAYKAVLKHGGPVRMVNRYGPTETTVSATAYTATSAIEHLERLPIGRPISNTRVYVLDKHLFPLPVGVTGELYIGGPGVANGYLNRPELTAERFLADSFSKVPGARMYRTGDLARYLPDGNLVFMGRNDNQVKIRGFRIELGEIEARLAEHPQVSEAVVLAAGDNSSDKRLVAYIVAAPHDNLIHTLREYLSVIMPDYMVPSAFVRMDAFPLTNNGKIDRRALPQPDESAFFTRDYEEPQGKVEVLLANIWADLLKIDRVGRHDNFFMLGGHSLLAVRLINVVRSTLGIDLKLHMLFSGPTLAELAKNLDVDVSPNTQDDEHSVLIPLKPQGSRPPLFCIHPAQGLSWSYRGLAKYLHPEQPLYGLQARGLGGKSPLASSIEEMTLDYINHIRNIQPRGPYHLLGWSFGGKVVHNMAVELQSQGESVPLLVIMDTTPEHSVKKEPMDPDVHDEHAMCDEYLDRLIGHYPTDDSLALKELVKPIIVNAHKLAMHFKPSVYSGDIVFFRTTAQENGRLSPIDPMCWKPYTRGGIEVHDVRCAHVEMDKPEHIAVVGRIVAARIEKLQ